MNTTAHLTPHVPAFLASYDAAKHDQIWKKHSEQFRRFWQQRVMGRAPGGISDAECDEIIRILDRNGKGNTPGSEAVARVMVAQGAWRRMFNELHANKALANLVNDVLTRSDPASRSEAIDALYKFNRGKKNRLTGPSGNVIGAFLAAYDPTSNVSIISLSDRHALIQALGLTLPFDWGTASVGQKIAMTNGLILNALADIGLAGSARVASVFVYTAPVRPLWKGEHIVRVDGSQITVAVPTVEEEEEEEDEKDISSEENLDAALPLSEVSEAMKIQARLAMIGEQMGFKIWLPRADRSRVLKAWTPISPNFLVDNLPLGYDSATMATIEQIDVIWLKNRSIVRAFEVEHTTAVYSGLLRMADLVALQPNIDVKLHIVASVERREKVLREIKRPVFSFIEGRKLKDSCTYLSYDSVLEISELEHLDNLNPKVIDKYVERASDQGEAH